MFKRIEIKNFQSHKNTVIDFDKGINSLCGESDNGKSAVIRAIRWLVDNRPLGTDKLNSNWNKDFKEDMSVKIFTDKGWVERIRNKKRNGYTICLNDKEPVELSAVGTDVPSEVKEFLNLSDINFQYQFDSPYLISMSAGDASKYLNNLIHLDSIDSILTVAEGNKRTISSEQKVVDKDISDLERELKNTEWVDEAESLYKRVQAYDKKIESQQVIKSELSSGIDSFRSLKVYDLSKQKKLVEEIENISIPDTSELKREIESYRAADKNIVDLSKQKKLVEEIENINIPDLTELKKEINDYKAISERILILKSESENLKGQLGDVCPLCGGKLEKGAALCF